MGSDNDLSSDSRLEYVSENSSVSNRESASNPPFEKASPYGRQPKEIVLLDD